MKPMRVLVLTLMSIGAAAAQCGPNGHLTPVIGGPGMMCTPNTTVGDSGSGISACSTTPPTAGAANSFCSTSTGLYQCQNGVSACTTAIQFALIGPGISSFTVRGAYAAGTSYVVADLVSQGGVAYVNTVACPTCADTPSGASTHWATPGPTGPTGTTGAQGIQGIQGVQGSQGTTGAAGAGYLATSTTSLAIANGVSKAFTTQTGLAYSAGARARAASAADGTNFMEGLVASYSGSTLTIQVDTIGGSGTKSDWNINVSGNGGATGAAGAQGTAGTNGTNGTNGAAGTNGAGFTYRGVYASRPGSPAAGDTELFTDATVAGACPPTGGGSLYSMCSWNGSAFVVPTGSTAGTMTQATPNSAANTVSVSVGTSGTAFAKTPVTIDPSTGAIGGTVSLPAAAIPATPVSIGATTHTMTAPREYFLCSTATACSVTLPVPAAGYEFCIRSDNNISTAITIAARTSILYEKTDRTGWGTAGNSISSGASVTNQICVIGYDATHYAIMSSVGTWTNN